MKTRDELINEMAADIFKELKVTQCNKPCSSCSEYHYCPLGIDATCAIDAGYRKQSDTVMEFVDRIAEFASAMRLLANKEYEESRLVKAMYAQGKMDAVGYMMKEIKKLAKEYGAEVEE